LGGDASGPVVATLEALSFWGGVDPATGTIIDVHHPLRGLNIAGVILMMPTSRGSCTGSGILLDLILNDRAPAALLFSEPEDVLTLGAIVGAEIFNAALPVLRLSSAAFKSLSVKRSAKLTSDKIEAEDIVLPIVRSAETALDLTARDRAMLDGQHGPAVSQAMRIVRRMALQQGATSLTDISRAHIDGCIYASQANLTFAEKLADVGAVVCVPTTMNAISVDRLHWEQQGVPPSFGQPAARLADAYVRMGCNPTFTCAPYLLRDVPGAGESIAWAESNAVIYANTVLAARTAKHPDFLDLCIALTGRAPRSGVYLDVHRRARRTIEMVLPINADDAFWPLVGYLAGKASPDRIPLLRGLAQANPSPDDLKALCAAFGTTSAAPMLHIEGITPEARGSIARDADRVDVTLDDFAAAWDDLNAGPEDVQLVAIGSPHASLNECHDLADGMNGRRRYSGTKVIVTAGNEIIAQAKIDGTFARLNVCGVELVSDLCWCSISEPVFPVATRTVITNSAKYAHYGPGLSGRKIRFGNLADCITAALEGRVLPRRPAWLTGI